jgi:hypothetical protein
MSDVNGLTPLKDVALLIVAAYAHDVPDVRTVIERRSMAIFRAKLLPDVLLVSCMQCITHKYSKTGA